MNTACCPRRRNTRAIDHCSCRSGRCPREATARSRAEAPQTRIYATASWISSLTVRECCVGTGALSNARPTHQPTAMSAPNSHTVFQIQAFPGDGVVGRFEIRVFATLAQSRVEEVDVAAGIDAKRSKRLPV